MSTEQAPTNANKEIRNTLNSHDPGHEVIPENEIHKRCDARCPAGARVRIDLRKASSLYFCGHHYNANAIDLLPVTMLIRDEREWRPEDPDFVPKPESKESVTA